MLAALEAITNEGYNYFANSPKKLHELDAFHKYANVIVKKFLYESGTRWLSFREVAARFYQKIPAIAPKLHADIEGGAVGIAKWLFNELLDGETLLGFAHIQPLLDELFMLSKAMQKENAFYLDIAERIDSAMQSITRRYLDSATAFNEAHFPAVKELLSFDSDASFLSVDEETGRIMFTVSGADFRHPITTPTRNRRGIVELDVDSFKVLIDEVREQFRTMATIVVEEMKTRFPPVDVIKSFSLVHPTFWGQDRPPTSREVKDLMMSIKNHYGVSKSMKSLDGSRVTRVPPLIDFDKLLAQQDVFQDVMRELSKDYISKPNARASDVSDDDDDDDHDDHDDADNPSDRRPCPKNSDANIPGITKLWRKISLSTTTLENISAWVRFANLALAIPIGSVDNERTFSAMKYIKSAIRNRLVGVHLNSCVRLFVQDSFEVHTFPYEKAYDFWLKPHRGKRGRYQVSI
jgi:hypothetical protein